MASPFSTSLLNGKGRMSSSGPPLTLGNVLGVEPFTNTLRTTDKIANVSVGGSNTSNIYLDTAGAHRVTISSEGMVGINTPPSAQHTLNVLGSINCTGTITINGNAINTGSYGVEANTTGSVLLTDPYFIYRYDQASKLIPVATSNDDFVSKDALDVTPDATYMVAGASNKAKNANAKAGKVYLWKRTVNPTNTFLDSWSEVDIDDVGWGTTGEEMGAAVALAPDAAFFLAGAPGSRTVYLFRKMMVGATETWERSVMATLPPYSASDRFGAAISVSQLDVGANGYYVVVGDSVRSLTGVVTFYFISASTWGVTALDGGYLYPPSSGVTGARFGKCVRMSLNGEYVVVGAPYDETPSTLATGTVYVMRRLGSGTNAYYSNMRHLYSSTCLPRDVYGWSVGIDGTGSSIVVGAPFHSNIAGTEAGAVYVYKRDTTSATPNTWTEVAQLVAPDTVSADNLGISVALSGAGTHFIVGAASEQNQFGLYAGSAHVFRYSVEQDAWLHMGKLTPLDGGTNNGFGQVVALTRNGEYAAVGAPTNTHKTTNGGAVYWFWATNQPFQYNVLDNRVLIECGVPGGLMELGSNATGTIRLTTSNAVAMDMQLSHVGIHRHLLPMSNVAYDLGSSNLRFRDLYLGGNSISLGTSLIRTLSNVAGAVGDVEISASSSSNPSSVNLSRLLVNEVQFGSYGESNIVRLVRQGNSLKFVQYDPINATEVNVTPIPNVYILGSNIGIGTPTPTVTLTINGTDAILIPKGSTAQRPAVPELGYVRYNTESNAFEGYGHNGTWRVLDGLADVNQDTFVSPESTPGANDDVLRFVNSNVETMRILPNGNIGIRSSNPLVCVDIQATDAMQLPKGTTAERPPGGALSLGLIRYNITTQSFEGYGAGNSWGTLGGLKDANLDTTIYAEVAPGTNDDVLRFVNSNMETMRITREGRLGVGASNPQAFVHIGSHVAATSLANLAHDVLIERSNAAGTGLAFQTLAGAPACISRATPSDGASEALVMNNAVMSFHTSNQTERMRITREGRLGVGTAAPDTRTHVHISAGDQSTVMHGPSLTWGGYLVVGAGSNVSSNNIAQVLSTDGSLYLDNGVGKTTYLNAYTAGNVITNTAGGGLGVGGVPGAFKTLVYGTLGTTGRVSVQHSNGILINSLATTGDGAGNKLIESQDASTWVWNTANNWGMYWARTTGAAYGTGSLNEVVLVGNGQTRTSFNLDTGGATYTGTVQAPVLQLPSGQNLVVSTGDVGGVQLNGAGNGGWKGYSIEGKYALVTDGSNAVGLYNDMDNQWVMQGYRNSYTDLRFAGSVRLVTTTTGVAVAGDAVVSGAGLFGGVMASAAKLHVNGATVLDGNATLRGQLSLGGHVVPLSNEQYDLGAASARFKDLFLSGTTIYMGTRKVAVDGNTSNLQIKDNNDQLSTLEAGALVVTGDISTPVLAGMVSFFARSAAPTGWLKADGAIVSRTVYAALFAAINTTFGEGDGSTTFKLPDLRGVFVRGHHDGSTTYETDTSRGFGTYQVDELKAHTHAASTGENGVHTHTAAVAPGGAHSHTVNSAPWLAAGTDYQGGLTSGTEFSGQGATNNVTNTTSAVANHTHGITVDSAGAHTHTVTVANTGGLETRPRNMNLLACIKF